MQMTSVSEAAWGAGFFEGEGSVRISKPAKPNKNLGYLCVDIPNTDRMLVRWFSLRWGGKLTPYERNGNRRPYWRWRVYALEARAFLGDIKAHIVSTRVLEKVQLAFDYQDQKSAARGRTRPADYEEIQWAYYEEMKRLNRRGVQ